MWIELATVLFLTNAVFSGTIPFSTDSTGAVIGTSANTILIGFNLLFGLMALGFSVLYGIWAFKGSEIM